MPFLSKGQVILAKRYVYESNISTYLHFKSDSTFEFQYRYDLIGDEAIGRYVLKQDTLLLTFTKDTSLTGNIYFEHENHRPDSLLIKGNKLYEIKNRRSREFDPQDSLHHRPPNKLYRRRFILFGYWYTHWSHVYMIDERYAKWATHKWLTENKALFE
jgi:hypothetical protein